MKKNRERGWDWEIGMKEMANENDKEGRGDNG